MAPARGVLALCWPGGLQEGQGLFNLLSQHSQYGFRSNRHLGDRTEAGSHVLYAGTEEMDLVVDNQETVVVTMRELDKLNPRVLLVVFLEVGEKLLAVAGVDCGRNAIGALCKHGEYTVVNEIVNQDDSAFGAANEIGNVCPGVPHATCGEKCFGKLFGRDFVDSIKYKVNLLISFLLMIFDVDNTLYHLDTLVDDLRYCREGSHDTDIDADGCF